MTQPATDAVASAPTPGLGQRFLKALSGSERPWDPTNRLGLLILCIVMVVALVPATAPTQIQEGQRRGGEERTQLKVPAPNDDPETLRPEEAQQAAEQIRRSAKTKLVSVIPTLMAVPQPLTSPMPQPTLLDGDHQRLSILSQPSRTLHFTLLGALLMSVALLVLYALLG